MSATPTKLALVTGANRGLGLETCRQLAPRGFRVLLASRGDGGRAAAQQLTREGLSVGHEPLDVADAHSIAACAERLRSAGAALDLLVNNAGITLDGFDAEVARRTLQVNFFGALQVTEALLPLLRDGGAIVMVSSGMGELSSVSLALRERFVAPELTRAALVQLMESFVEDVAQGRHKQRGWPSSAYRVSKVGMNALTRILAREFAARAIAVNAVCPGWVRTDMGGSGAPRSVEEGAASIIAIASQPHGGPTGGFFRDGKAIAW